MYRFAINKYDDVRYTASILFQIVTNDDKR